MTFDNFKEIFRTHGSVIWNGSKYKATGIQCVRRNGELITSARITGDAGRVNYWVNPDELSAITHDRKGGSR